jgi:hypothetical protein
MLSSPFQIWLLFRHYINGSIGASGYILKLEVLSLFLINFLKRREFKNTTR